MENLPRRFASPLSKGAALAVRQSRPGGAAGWRNFMRRERLFGLMDN
jgi:hypothetical protein